MAGKRENFVRLDDLDPRLPSLSVARQQNYISSISGPLRPINGSNDTSTSFQKGIRKGSKGIKSIGRSLGFGVYKAVFPEDLKVSENKIFDPQDKTLLIFNKLFVMSCTLSVIVDPFFFYLPVINGEFKCLGIDKKLAIVATTLRTIIDLFYLAHMALQYRTAYIAPSSRVFGRGELVIDPAQITKRYLQRWFVVDFLSVLPAPQKSNDLLRIANTWSYKISVRSSLSCTVAINKWMTILLGTGPRNLFCNPNAELTSMIIILHLTLGYIQRLFYHLALCHLRNSYQNIVIVCGGDLRT